MLTSNPFSELSTLIPATAMQGYVLLMLLLVVGGTLIDIIHKKSARYFFAAARKSREARSRDVNVAEKTSVAAKTLAHDVLASGEFCNVRRRAAHLLTMYGFLLFVVTTAVMLFAYPAPDAATPAILPLLWHLHMESWREALARFVAQLRLDEGLCEGAELRAHFGESHGAWDEVPQRLQRVGAGRDLVTRIGEDLRRTPPRP